MEALNPKIEHDPCISLWLPKYIIVGPASVRKLEVLPVLYDFIVMKNSILKSKFHEVIIGSYFFRNKHGPSAHES